MRFWGRSPMCKLSHTLRSFYQAIEPLPRLFWQSLPILGSGHNHFQLPTHLQHYSGEQLVGSVCEATHSRDITPS